MKTGLRRRAFLKAGLAAGAAALLTRLQTGRPPSDPNTSQIAPFLQESSRIKGPHWRGKDGALQPLDWDAAIRRLADALHEAAPHQTAFLLGATPDSLYHLAAQFAQSIGGAQVLRWSPLADLEGQAALLDAARLLLGSTRLPIFDPQQSELVFSFGASTRESWIAPAAGHAPAPCWVQFEPRRSQTARMADLWVPIRPGSEAQLAQALWEHGNGGPSSALETAAKAAGVPVAQLQQLAKLFFRAGSRLALPGGAALSAMDGLKAAEWMLRLNLPAAEGTGLFLAPPSPLHPELPARFATAAELSALAEQMRFGKIKLLIVHGVDLLGALPTACGLREALSEVETVVSLSPYLDGTASCANLLLPDHAGDESWGYQAPASTVDRGLVSLITPSHPPRRNTRPSAEVLIQLSRQLKTGQALPYLDEQDYLRCTLEGLDERTSFQSPLAFFHNIVDHGSWQRPCPVRFPPIPTPFAGRLHKPAEIAEKQDLLLQVFEAEDDISAPAQAHIHPLAALRRGLTPGEQVRLVTAQGEVCLPLLFDTRLHPDALAIPWTPGGDPAPLALIGRQQSATGGLVFSGLPVRIERTG